MRKYLTCRQLFVFNFIREQIYGGLPPRLRDIAEHCGLTVSRARQIVCILEKKGYLHSKPNAHRAIRLLPPYRDDTRYSVRVEKDFPELSIYRGDFLTVDTNTVRASPGDPVLVDAGDIRRFVVGDSPFGKVVGVSRSLL